MGKDKYRNKPKKVTLEDWKSVDFCVWEEE